MPPALKLVWNIDFTFMMKKRVKLETKEGLILSGKLTSIEFQDVTVAGTVIQLPIAFELDGSHHERIPFQQLVTIDLVK